MLSVDIKYLGIVVYLWSICNLQLRGHNDMFSAAIWASRSPSTESETGCSKIDEAGEAFVENHVTQQKLTGYLGNPED